MSKIVIVAEKPDVGTRLAATLGGCYINGTELKPDMLGSRKWEGIIKKERFTKGYLGCNYHGRELIVTWGFGHMAELKQAADYDPKYRRWSETLFPFIPPSYEIKLKEGAGLKKHFQLLKKLLTARDTEYIINATDADREGELIFDYIYRLSGSRKPFKRLWISSFTEEAVINGFKQLKDSEAVKALTEAGRCRAIADWLVGANFTALSTVKFGGFRNMISVGRVQTPTLALLVNRELEIQGFAPETYFELVATFLTAKGETYLGKWQVGKTDRFKDHAAATEVLARVEGKDGLVTKHETTTNKELPPLLYDLNTLQGDANSRFGLSAKKTLDIAQKLYENQLITYPRTNSRYLTTDLQPEISRVIRALPPEYEPWRETLLGKNLPISPRIFNNAKVESHHAIIPTYKTAKNLTPEEQKIYGLVARSILKAFMPPAVWGNTKVVTEVAGELFYSSGRVLLDPGWRSVDGKQSGVNQAGQIQEGRSINSLNRHVEHRSSLTPGTEGQLSSCDANQILPVLVKGERVAGQRYEVLTKQTTPPKRFTEKTLLSAMETAGKLVEDEEMREAMKDHGLGTPATRASIIERLIQVEYIKREGKNLLPTEKGIGVIQVLPVTEIKSPGLTGEWEYKLQLVERGQLQAEKFLQEITEFTQNTAAVLKDTAKQQISTPTISKKGKPGDRPKRKRAQELGKGDERPRVNGTDGSSDTGIAAGTDRYRSERFAGERDLAGPEQTGILPVGTKTAARKQNGMEENFHATIPAGLESLGKCPKCGLPVTRNKKGFGCTGWKEGCKFQIWSPVAGKNLTDVQGKQLLAKGATAKLQGFKSKAGKPFAAVLELIPEGDGKLNFRF